jgi:hypothetical protein
MSTTSAEMLHQIYNMIVLSIWFEISLRKKAPARAHCLSIKPLRHRAH